jgi:hypothetical protein
MLVWTQLKAIAYQTHQTIYQIKHGLSKSRVSKDYELLPQMSKAMIYGAMIQTMLRRLATLKQQCS